MEGEKAKSDVALILLINYQHSPMEIHRDKDNNIHSEKEDHMTKYRLKGLGLILLMFCFLLWSPKIAKADKDEDILKRINALQEMIQRQQEELNTLKNQLQEQGEALKKASMPKEEIKQAVKDEIKQAKIEPLPEWARRIKLGADLRLRYEGLYGRKTYDAKFKETETYDRNRWRYRLRAFVSSQITDEIDAMFSFGSSSGTSIANTTVSNTTFGDAFSQKPDYILQAHARYRPKWLPGAEFWGGKFKPPFIFTDIMWDPDTAVEGFYEAYKYTGLKNFQPFIGLGQFIVDEVSTKTDAELFFYQAGFELNVDPVKWTLAGSYYGYDNLKNSGLNWSGFGNSVDSLNRLKYDFRLFDLVTYLDFNLGNLPVRLFGNYANNVADNVPSDSKTAYSLGFTLNKIKNPHDWELFYKYSYIEPDAVIGAFADGDFYFANRQGHKGMFTYRLFKYVDFRTSYFITDVVKKVSTQPNGDPEQRLQVDFIFRF